MIISRREWRKSMSNLVSRRRCLGVAGAASALTSAWSFAAERAGEKSNGPGASDATPPATRPRIVDMHVHFDEKKPNYIAEFLKLSERLNLTACMLTPFANR